jgi:hypothetical protein
MEHQGVFQDFEVFVHRGPRHLGVIGQLGEVHDRGVAQRGYLEKPAEGRDVPRRPFRHDFLLEIGPRIGLEIRARILREVDGRQQPPLCDTLEVEVTAQLSVRQGMEVFRPCPSS